LKKLLVISVLAVIAASCAKAPDREEVVVLGKAEELSAAMYRKDFGKVWDLMSPWNKHDAARDGLTREIFAGKLGSSHGVRITDYDSSALIAIGNKYAITQAEVTYELTEGDKVQTLSECERTIWLQFPEGWFWQQTGLLCTYTPDAEEIERLTRNLK
jgi:hypothetical protein